MENNYLLVDDIFETDTKPISREILEQYPMPQKGKVISGTFGNFRIR